MRALPAFVGRQKELAELAARKKAALAGHGCVVLISGETGCGKSRLLEEFAATLKHGRARLLKISPEAYVGSQQEQLRRPLEDDSPRFTVVLVDDAHDAPQPLLDALVKLASNIARRRMLMVAAYRATELERGPEAMLALAKLARIADTGTIDLAPLGHDETMALIEGFTSEGESLPKAVRDAIEQRSGGNPLLVRELSLHAAKCASREGADATLPLAICGLVAEWLAPLCETEREVLAHAALMPAGFSTADIVAGCGLERERVTSALRRARLLGLIHERRDAGKVYSFRHRVVAEVLERDFLVEEAQAIHARIARAIETSGATQAHAAELAEHWRAAGNTAMAAAYAERAGDGAFAKGDYFAAAWWYERAAGELKPEDPSLPHVYEKLARSLDRSGNPLDAHLVLGRTATALDTAGESERATRLRIYDALLAQYQSDVRLGIARLESTVRFGVMQTSERYAQAVAAFFLALRQEPERALALIADFPCEDGATDPAAIVKYWETVMFVATIRCDRATFERAAAQYLQTARRTGDPALITQTESDVAICTVHFAGNACDALLERAIAMAQEHGVGWIEGYTRAFAALNDFVRGRLDTARRHINAITSLGEMPMIAIARMYAGISTGRALCDADLVASCARPELLEAAFRSGVPSVFGRVAGPYAQWLAEHGQLEEARLILHRCVSELRLPYGTFLTVPVVAEYADDRDVASARRLLLAAARNPEDRISAATLALFDAICSSRRGDMRATQNAAAAAAEHYGALGWFGMQAYAAELSGDTTQATQLYARCGNLRELRRLELSGAYDSDERAQPRDAILSPRERSIVDLVALGKSNRAVASALSISEKTVERNLTSIFEKLGFRSRTELAASAAAHQTATR